jgi:hypothetical protein
MNVLVNEGGREEKKPARVDETILADSLNFFAPGL